MFNHLPLLTGEQTGCRHEVWVTSWNADLSDLERMAKTVLSSDILCLDLQTTPDWNGIPDPGHTLKPVEMTLKANTIQLGLRGFGHKLFVCYVFIVLMIMQIELYMIHTNLK